MNLYQYLEEQYSRYPSRLPFADHDSLPPEASTVRDAPISLRDTPYILELFSMQDTVNVSPDFNVKVAAVDEWIRSVIEQEGLRDSPEGYKTIINRFMKDQAESMEQMILSKRGIELIERLFAEVAIKNKQSVKTFLKTAQKNYKKSHIQKSKKILREALETLTTK